ncbi:hypothetical protein L7F22_068237 [Adiantum nelumboides]|nr:hypothetical protein [Adiantum nelumboides]
MADENLLTETSTPSLTRRSSWNSSQYGSDADLIGIPTDIDGNPIEVTEVHPTSSLTDLMNTFWVNKPRIDLDALDKKLKQASDRVRQRMQAASSHGKQRSDAQSSQSLKDHHREELRRMRAKVSLRVEKLSKRWAEQKNVRLRDKISFVIGVMNLVVSSLIFAYRPEWMYISYSIQCAFFLPIRIFTYFKLHWHYFLFDYCYFANILNLAFIWFFPDNKFLFLACYCSSHGPLAFSIATWRNSAVFHSLEKMTSLFIHLYPPLTFCAMRHFMPETIKSQRFPAIKLLPFLDSWTAFAWNVTFYLVWQMTYYFLISQGKKEKIASGQRINSYSHMSKGKGAVAKVLAKAPDERREWAFIALQFVYTIVCTLPAPLLFYNSYKASAIFCLSLILLSVWNGAGYYVEVWGRRFERELEALRREVERNSLLAANNSNNPSALSDGEVTRQASEEVQISDESIVKASDEEIQESEGAAEKKKQKKRKKKSKKDL